MPNTHTKNNINNTQIHNYQKNKQTKHNQKNRSLHWLLDQPNNKDRLTDQLIYHHDIIAKISEGTFTADKIVRLISNVIKVIRLHNFVQNIKCLQRLGSQMGQLRRFLRFDRFFLILKDFLGYFSKQNMSVVDVLMVIFKTMIFIQDCTDIIAFSMQLKIIKNDNLMPQLKKRVTNLYFFQCIGWLLFYSYEYYKAQTIEAKKRNRIVIVRYMLDSITSHNDFSFRKISLSPKLTCILGVISSILNLYLVWK